MDSRMSKRTQLATKTSSSKSTRSKFWFVRVDGEEKNLKESCEVLSSGLDVVSFIAAYHTGSTGTNPHIHACIEIASEVQKQSFAVRLKAIFPRIKERNDYSLEVWDGNKSGEGAVSYLFHDDGVSEDSLIGVKGFTSDEIRGAIQANKAVQAVVAINKERASTKLVDKTYEAFKGQCPTKFTILKYMLEKCREGENYYPGSYLLKKYVEEVELRLTETEEELSRLATEMVNNLWR